MTKVSIVVPVYNVKNYLCRCIDSLVNQTLKEIEIILVDDASTDESGAICDEYKSKYEKIKVIHKEQNEGLGEARNTGIEVASGEYIAFVDGDDYVELDAYEICYNRAKEHSVDTLIFGYYNDTPTGVISHSKEKYEGLFKDEEIMESLFPLAIGTLPEEREDYGVGFAPCWQLIRLNLLKENKIRFVSERKIIYEDFMFALDLYPHLTSSMIIKEPLYHYVANPESLTMSVRPEKYKRIKDMYYYLKETQPYNDLLFQENNIILRFKRIMMSYIRLCIMQLSSDRKHMGLIKEITSDEMCKEVFMDYPIEKLPIKQFVFAFLIKRRWNKLLFFVVNRYVS